MAETIAETRTCKCCLVSKSLTSEFFPANSSRCTTLGWTCRQCVAERNRKRWRENPDAKLMDKKVRDANRDKIREYDRMRVRRDKDKKQAIIDRWIDNNPERHSAMRRSIAHNARARKLGSNDRITTDEILSLRKIQENSCFWCGCDVSETYHIDHKIALCNGGANLIENIVISCPSCNFSKNKRHPDDFLQSR